MLIEYRSDEKDIPRGKHSHLQEWNNLESIFLSGVGQEGSFNIRNANMHILYKKVII